MEEEKIIITLDGAQWNVLWGDNIQEGITAFGNTIDEAMINFAYEILKWAEKNIPATRIRKLQKFVEDVRGVMGFGYYTMPDMIKDLEIYLRELEK